MSRMTLVVLASALVALAACGDPVKGIPVPLSGNNSAPASTTTTTTTMPGRSSAEPTTTTTAPVTTTSVAPELTLSFDAATLLTVAELSEHTGVSQYAPSPEIIQLTDVTGVTLRYFGYGNAAVDVTLVSEPANGPTYQKWLAQAKQDGTFDPQICQITAGFCSGGNAARKGQPDGPTKATFMVHAVKGIGPVTVRIALVGEAKTINSVKTLTHLADLVEGRLPR